MDTFVFVLSIFFFFSSSAIVLKLRVCDCPHAFPLLGCVSDFNYSVKMEKKLELYHFPDYQYWGNEKFQHI